MCADFLEFLLNYSHHTCAAAFARLPLQEGNISYKLGLFNRTIWEAIVMLSAPQLTKGLAAIAKLNINVSKGSSGLWVAITASGPQAQKLDKCISGTTSRA